MSQRERSSHPERPLLPSSSRPSTPTRRPQTQPDAPDALSEDDAHSGKPPPCPPALEGAVGDFRPPVLLHERAELEVLPNREL